MTIAYIRPYDGELALVQAGLAEHTIVTADCVRDITDADRQAVEVLCVFVDYEVTADVLDMLPNLKCIATRSAGFDHIAYEAAQVRGIVVTRVPHYGARTVAEYTVALMFALSRNAYRAYTDMQRNANVQAVGTYEGFDLYGKTLGVVGTGAIGKSVCQIARGIGMQVLAHDVQPDHEFAVKNGLRYADLDDVLAQSDLVTLHVPSLPDTYHLINEQKLALMKSGSYLINTARGEIVDTLALVAALRLGHLAGAGLDVLEGEHELRSEIDLLSIDDKAHAQFATLVADHALIDMPNVIVTPHIAFNTVEAKREIIDVTIGNIEALVAGMPRNLVNHV